MCCHSSTSLTEPLSPRTAPTMETVVMQLPLCWLRIPQMLAVSKLCYLGLGPSTASNTEFVPPRVEAEEAIRISRDGAASRLK
jgi:hypothetical protein